MEEKNDGKTKPTTTFDVEDVEDEEEAPMETTANNAATALPNSPSNPLLRCKNCKKVWNNCFQALGHNCNQPDLLCYEEGLPSSSELEQEKSDENGWSDFLSELSSLCESIPQSAEEPELPTDGEPVQSVEESSPMETKDDDSNKKRNDEPEVQKTESTRPQQLEEIHPCSSKSCCTQEGPGAHVHLEQMEDEQHQISDGIHLMKITTKKEPEHTPAGSYINLCCICNREFKSLLELTDHMLAHEVDLEENPHRSGHCTCTNRKTTRYYPNYGLVCDGCEEVFDNDMQQRNHVCPNLCPSHSRCKDCGKEFKNPEQIKNHICPKLNMAFGKNEESTSKKQNDESTSSGKNGKNGKTISSEKNGKSNSGENAKNSVQQKPQKNGNKPPKPEPLVCKFCNLQFQTIPHLIAHEKKEHKAELERLRNTPKADRSTENQEGKAPAEMKNTTFGQDAATFFMILGLAMATDQRSADQGLDSSTDTEETIPIPRPPPSGQRTSNATGITITPIPPTKSEKKGKRHPCRKCRRPFPTLATRTEHERNCFVKPADPVQKPTVAEAPTKKEFHKCEECDFVGHSVQQLLEHVEAKHQDWMKCKFCEKKFQEERNYDRHKCDGHQPKPVKPKRPANESEDDDDDNNNNDDPPRKPDYQANRKKIILPRFSNERPSKMCDYPGCGFKYYDETTLRLHLDQAHPHKKNDKNAECDKNAEEQNASQGRKKEWLCHICGGIFEEKDRDSHVCMGLQPEEENNNDFHASYGHHPAPAHLAEEKDPAHSDFAAAERKNNERPKKAKKKKDKNQKKEWLCNVCGEKFRYEILFKGHIREGHTKLCCSKCPKIFNSRVRYFRHLNTHVYYKCKVCKARFFKLRSMNMHIWTSNHNGHYPSSWHYYVRCFKCRKWIPNHESLKAHASTCFLKQKKR